MREHTYSATPRRTNSVWTGQREAQRRDTADTSILTKQTQNDEMHSIAQRTWWHSRPDGVFRVFVFVYFDFLGIYLLLLLLLFFVGGGDVEKCFIFNPAIIKRKLDERRVQCMAQVIRLTFMSSIAMCSKSSGSSSGTCRSPSTRVMIIDTTPHTYSHLRHT